MNITRIALFLILSLNIILGLNVTADDQPFILEEITVTGTRTERDTFGIPGAISTVTAIEIGRRSPGTAPDLLREETGVEVQKTTAGQGSPIIRGLTGYHTLILIDGVRLNNSTFRSGPNQYMATIDPGQIEKIEVMRGMGSSLYGSSAMGGVINVITKSPTLNKNLFLHPYISTKFSGADKGRFIRGGFDGGYGSLSLLAGFSYKDVSDLQPGKGYDIQLPNKKFLITSQTDPQNLPEKSWLVDKLTPTGWKEQDGDVKLVYNLSEKQNIKLAYQGVRQKDVPRYDKLATKEFDVFLYTPQNRDLTYLNYTANKLIPFVDLIQTSLSYHRQEEGQKQQKAKSTSLSEINDTTGTIGLSIQLDSSISRHKLIYGSEFYHDKIDSKLVKTDLNTQKTTNKAWGTFPDGSEYWDANAYIQDSVKILKNLEAILSGRYTYYQTKSDLSIGDPAFGTFDDSGNAFTGSAGLVYGITDYLNLTLSAGQGFRAPNLSDTTGVAVTNQGIDAPSPGLKPEQSRGIDVGLKTRSGYFTASINYYYNRINNLIIRVPIEKAYPDKELPALYKDIQKSYEGIPLFVKDNTDRAHIQGIELALSRLELPSVPAVSIFGSLNFTRGEDETNKQPIRREQPLNGLLGIRWEKGGRFWVESFSRFAEKQDRLSEGDILDPRIPGLSIKPSDNDPMGYNPGWFTLNIRGGISLNDWTRIMLGVENILDRRYREYGSGVDAPGRNFVIGADYRF